MGKILELKSSLKTKKEWKEYANMINEAGLIKLDGFNELLNEINNSDLQEE